MKTLLCLVAAGGIAAAGLFSVVRLAGPQADPAPAAAPQVQSSAISPAELQTLIAEVYHVETSRFIQPDLLWVTLPAGQDVQATCQAIAQVWSFRSGLPWVRVESWQGGHRLAQATVQR